MGNWWKITRLEIYLGLKDKQAFIWGLLAPLLFTAFIGYAFGNEDETGSIEVAFNNGDNPAYVETIFRRSLERENIIIANGKNIPEICVSDSLIEGILEGKGGQVTVRVEDESRAARMTAAKVRKVLFSIFFHAKQSWLRDPPSNEEVETLSSSKGPLMLSTSTLGRLPRKPAGAERTLPSVLVMFLLFSLFTFFAGLWVEDTKTGKIRRITLSPTSMKDLFIAQIFSRILWGIMQVVVVGIVATLLFQIKWELPVFSTAVLLLCYMFAITALGLFFGSLFQSAEKAHIVGVILSLVLAAIGGCWWPLEIVSAPMKTAALFTPTGLTMDAFGSFLADGRFSPFPVFNVVSLAAIGIIVMPLAIIRMKKQIIK